MGGVGDNGEVAYSLDRGNSAEVEGIPGVIREGADAPFAKNDASIAFGHDVFGGHEPFIDGGSHAALEKEGFFHLAGQAQERVVLHVPGADLDDVSIISYNGETFAIDSLGDNQ